jgi:hypothetical protein
VLQLFICKTEIKICFERWLFLSTTGNGVLTIFHTKQVLREIGTFVLFYKVGTPPHFSFHKPWLTDSIGCPPTFIYHGGVSFFFYFFWNITIWKIANPTTTSPWAKNSVTKWEVFWRFFWKVAHENLLGMACKYHAYEFIVDTWNNLVFGSWMHE